MSSCANPITAAGIGALDDGVSLATATTGALRTLLGRGDKNMDTAFLRATCCPIDDGCDGVSIALGVSSVLADEAAIAAGLGAATVGGGVSSAVGAVTPETMRPVRVALDSHTRVH